MLVTMIASAQATQDFSFSGTNVHQSSINGVAGCHNNVGITVTTTDHTNGTPVSHELNGTSMLMPYDLNNDPVNAVLVVINFSTPIRNPRLAVRDIDYKAAFVPWTTYPHEWLSNLTPGYMIAPYGAFPIPVDLPAGTVTPLNGAPPADRDASCWLEWSGCHTSLSFVYNRVGQQLGLYLDQLEFECVCDPCPGCNCETQVNLLDAETTTNELGQLSAHLEILSGTASIRQVNISLPWYDMVASPECIDCDGHDITMNGHIYTATPLGGENATFLGLGGTGHSGEVTYCFDGVPVNDQVNLKLIFPELLDLACCKPDVEYCLKVEVIDKDCRYCEFMFCVPSAVKGEGRGRSAPTAPNKVAVEKADTGSLLIYPNPTTGRMQAVIPTSHAAHAYTIHDQSGKQVMSGTAKGTLLDLDVTTLSPGQYIFSLGDLEASFVVQR